jgi:hypothetical protein
MIHGTSMRISVLPILLAAGIATLATAEGVGGGIDLFVSRCLREGPKFEATLSKARQEGWAPLAADMAMAFTPVDDPIAIEGWMIGDGEGTPFEALVVYKAMVGRRTVEGCTTASAGSDARSVEKGLKGLIQARPLGEEQGQDTIYKRFSTNVAGRDIAITLTLPRYPRGTDQVLASAVAEELVEN